MVNMVRYMSISCLAGGLGAALLALSVRAESASEFTATVNTPAVAEEVASLDVTRRFVEAENMTGYPAIFRWRELYQQDAKVLAALPRGKEGVRIRLVQAILSAVANESSTQRRQDWLDEVELMASLTPDPMQRTWINIMMLKVIGASDHARVEKTIRLASNAIEKISDAYARAYAAAAFAEVLLTSSSSDTLDADVVLDKARFMLSHHIVTAHQRARVAHFLAYKELSYDPSYASVFQLTDAKDRGAQLFAMGKQKLAEGHLEAASRLVRAAQLDDDDARTDVLKEIAQKQIDADALQDAFMTIWGISSDKTQNQQLKKIAEDLLDADEVPSAEIVAAQVDEGVTAVTLWTQISAAYRKKGYITRMQQVHAHAWTSAGRITRPARRAQAYAILARALSDQGVVKHIPYALKQARSDKRYQVALGAYVQELAHQEQQDAARKVLDAWELKPLKFSADDDSDENKTLVKDTLVSRDLAVTSVAMAYARAGQGDVAEDVLQGVKDTSVSAYDDALLAVVTWYTQEQNVENAQALVAKMRTPSAQAKAYAELAARMHQGKGDAEEIQRYVGLASRTIVKESQTEKRDDALVVIGSRYLEVGMLPQAQALFGTAISDEAQAGLHTAMARYYASKGMVPQAQEQAEKVGDDDLRDKAYAAVSDALVRANHVRDAMVIIRKMKGDIPRVQAFHSAARTQAYRTDFYGLMKGMSGNATPPQQLASPGNVMPSPTEITDAPVDEDARKQFEAELIAESKTSSDSILMKPPLPSAIGRSVPALDVNALQVNENTATLAARVPANTDFVVTPVSYEHPLFQQKFYTAMGTAGFAGLQQRFAPEVLMLERGVADISGLYLALRAQGFGDEYMTKQGRVYTLRKPIVIAPEATLVISGADVKELRLSSDRGAYITNAGRLYVQDTRVSGWNEALQKEDYAGIDDKYRFRPFIVSWSRSHTFMGGSVFTALGYSSTKAYGISITSGPKDVMLYKPESITPPDGVIAENSFRNLYYGFYSYEAQRVALIGNEYKDNIIYGIDPHDRSRYLTIAFNAAWGTMKKHGIIISREVNDTTIIGNLAFENHGSGLMIDRLSVSTMMYGNTSFDNGQDGITIFESDCKLIASNRLFSNKRNGLKVRNARDVGVFYNVIHDNKQAAIEGYISDLRKDPAHITRNFTLDPYSDINAMTVVGNWIERNGAGIGAWNTAALFLRGNYFVQQSPRLWQGTWKDILADITMRFNLQHQGAVITPRCPTGQLLEHRHACRFRTEGFFSGDGQDTLEERIGKQLCGVRS